MAGWLRLGERASLRVLGRINALLPYPRPAERFSSPYVPGVGLVTRSRVPLGAGLTLQYDYRLYPRAGR